MRKLAAIICLLSMTLTVQADSHVVPDPNSAHFAFVRENFKMLSAFACGFVGTVSQSLEAPYESLFYRIRLENSGHEKIKMTGNCGIRIDASGKSDLGDELNFEIDIEKLKKAYYENAPMVIKGLVGEYRFKFQFKFIRDLELKPRVILETFNYYRSAASLPDFVNLVEMGSESLSPNKTDFFAWAWPLAQGKRTHVVGKGFRSGQSTVLWTNTNGRIFMNQQTIPQYEWGNGRGGEGADASDLIFIPMGSDLLKGCSTFLGRGEKMMTEDKCSKRIRDFGI